MFDLNPPAPRQTFEELLEIILNDPADFTIHVQTSTPGHFVNVESIDKEQKLVKTLDSVIRWDRITGIFYFNVNTFHKALK